MSRRRASFVLLAVALLASATLAGPGPRAESRRGSGPAAQPEPGGHPLRQAVGRSVEGRPIVVRRRGDRASAFEVLVVGSIHGDEPEGIRVSRRLERGRWPGLAGIDLWSVRTANPDGLARGTRGNARGVDLNRNFPRNFDPGLSGGYESGPRPLSEPEARAVAGLSRRVGFDLAIWYHQPWGRTLVPCHGDRAAARRYARLSGLGSNRACDPEVPGSAIDWQHHAFGTSAFVVEFAAGRLPAAASERHARAVVRLARELAAAARAAS